MRYKVLIIFVVMIFMSVQTAMLPTHDVAAQGATQNATAQVGSCADLLPTRLAVGVVATVSAVLPGDTAVPVRVHFEPSVSSSIYAQFQTGDTFLIQSGPKCAGGYRWWKIVAEPNG